MFLISNRLYLNLYRTHVKINYSGCFLRHEIWIKYNNYFLFHGLYLLFSFYYGIFVAHYKNTYDEE